MDGHHQLVLLGLRRQNGHHLLFRLEGEAQQVFRVLHAHTPGVEDRTAPGALLPCGIHHGIQASTVHHRQNERISVGRFHLHLLLTFRFPLRLVRLAQHLGHHAAHARQGDREQDPAAGTAEIEALIGQFHDPPHAVGGDQGNDHVLLRLGQAKVIQYLGIGGAQPHAEVVEMQALFPVQAHRSGALPPVYDGHQHFQHGQMVLTHQSSTSSL